MAKRAFSLFVCYSLYHYSPVVFNWIVFFNFKGILYNSIENDLKYNINTIKNHNSIEKIDNNLQKVINKKK